jgi:hypothetical protein
MKAIVVCALLAMASPAWAVDCETGYLWRPGDGCVKSDAGGVGMDSAWCSADNAHWFPPRDDGLCHAEDVPTTSGRWVDIPTTTIWPDRHGGGWPDMRGGGAGGVGGGPFQRVIEDAPGLTGGGVGTQADCGSGWILMSDHPHLCWKDGLVKRFPPGSVWSDKCSGDGCVGVGHGTIEWSNPVAPICPAGDALLAYPGTWTLVCARDLQIPK